MLLLDLNKQRTYLGRNQGYYWEVQIKNVVFVLQYCLIPLTQCNKEIKKHKRSLKFSGVETEVELILARCGCFEKPSNFLEMTICPTHRARLGIGWQRPSGLCSVPEVVLGHCKDLWKVPTMQKGINLSQSISLLELTNQFVPVGSGK